VIVARFRCTRLTADERGDDVRLEAVSLGRPQDINESWSDGPPAGQIFMLISCQAARGQFHEGVDYIMRIEADPSA
jgi:hypothetical protein